MPCVRRRLFVRVRVRGLLLEVLAGEVRGPIAVLDRAGELDRRSQGAPSPRAVTTPAGTQTAQLWVDERRGVNLVGRLRQVNSVGRRMRTPSGRGGGRRAKRRGCKGATGVRGSKALTIQESRYHASKQPPPSLPRVQQYPSPRETPSPPSPLRTPPVIPQVCPSSG